MEGYSVKVRESSKELTPKEKIAMKDTSNAVSLDEITSKEGNVTIDFAYYVILDVHNEKSDNKDYTKTVVVDKAGNKFVTGSESFRTAMIDIVDEMTDAGCADEITLEVFRKESKNYKGKQFISCSLT